MSDHPRIFDCFTFFDELDLLQIRLDEVGSIVDRFVLVEATKTFQGDDKPLVFEREKMRFAPWLDKIEHVIIDFPAVIPHLSNKSAKTWGKDRATAWDREFYQRDQILRGLNGAGPNDLIMVSDIDEIPRRTALEQMLARKTYAGKLLVFLMRYYRFYLNCRTVPAVNGPAPTVDDRTKELTVRGFEFGSSPDNDEWNGLHLIERRYLTTPSKLRRARIDPPKFWRKIGLGDLGLRLRNQQLVGMSNPVVKLHDSGWHFSSLGGHEEWVKKAAAFSHAEYKDTIEYRSKEAFDRWFRQHEIVPIDDLPDAVGRNPDAWRHRIYSPESSGS